MNEEWSLDSLYRYTWNSELNDWEISSKQEYLHDSNNNITLSIFYKWRSGSNDWENSSKYEYLYDSNNNQTSERSYNWSIYLNDWSGYFKSCSDFSQRHGS